MLRGSYNLLGDPHGVSNCGQPPENAFCMCQSYSYLPLIYPSWSWQLVSTSAESQHQDNLRTNCKQHLLTPRDILPINWCTACSSSSHWADLERRLSLADTGFTMKIWFTFVKNIIFSIKSNTFTVPQKSILKHQFFLFYFTVCHTTATVMCWTKTKHPSIHPSIYFDGPSSETPWWDHQSFTWRQKHKKDKTTSDLQKMIKYNSLRCDVHQTA